MRRVQEILSLETNQETEEKTAEELLEFLSGLAEKIPLNRDMLVGYMIAFNQARFWLHGKTPHVQEGEAEYIRVIYDAGFTIGDLALIMDRSKSTIHAVVNQKGVSE